ncbi:MAG: hypothetical protein AAF583_03940 [Pseudomonadota bacterium]
MQLRPGLKNPLSVIDFVRVRTNDGTAFRTLALIDEHSRECLTIEMQRMLRLGDFIYAFAGAMLKQDVLRCIQSDNRPKFIAVALWEYFERIVVQTRLIELGSPLETGYCKIVNGNRRGALLNAEIFCSLKEATMLIVQSRHSALQHRKQNHPSKPSGETLNRNWLRYRDGSRGALFV